MRIFLTCIFTRYFKVVKGGYNNMDIRQDIERPKAVLNMLVAGGSGWKLEKTT
jgi:hypothetical protein